MRDRERYAAEARREVAHLRRIADRLAGEGRGAVADAICDAARHLREAAWMDGAAAARLAYDRRLASGAMPPPHST